jgi:prolyl oligopeptidase
MRANPRSDAVYLEFTSFVTPKTVLKISTRSPEKPAVWATSKFPFDLSAFEVSQVRYPSKDGTAIPMFLVHRRGLAKNGEAPTILYGYGGFNNSVLPAFKATYLPWLEAGGIYAIANLRGGGEFGRAWHDAGRLDKKQNVFDDFIAAGEYLVKEGYTKPERLAIKGGSNGGLLVGAAMVQRPDLFRAVVCAVPLLDMLRYHKFGSGQTWTPEYGSPDKADEFKWLQAYSPYHHVKKGAQYPALLMESADTDDRVDPMHARKFVAAVQAASSSGRPAYLRIETNAGHSGGDQLKKTAEAMADEYAFLFGELGVSWTPTPPPSSAGAASSAPPRSQP